jgi:predicted flap endonuclease-1-like 5' DNA nuclease
MQFAYIFLVANSILVGLALCIVPFILGWLAAMAFYKVMDLRSKVDDLTASNTELTGKVDKMTSEITELRVKISQEEAEIYDKNEQLRKLKNELVICEAERNNLRIAAAEGKGGAAKTAAPASITFAGKKFKTDDLAIIEGIGPKIAELLVKAGIKTWKALAETKPERIQEILDAAGTQYNMHVPDSWPHQAALAAAGNWDELKKMQDELDAGK